jgi:hypothetical protein
MTRSSTIRVLGVAGAVMAMAVVGSQAQVSDDGLLAAWLLDEGSGDIAADSSDNGNDGTFVEAEGLPEWADGMIGGGVQFSQAGWIDTAAPILVGGASFTMGAYIKPGGEQKAFTNIMSSHAEPPRRGVSFEQNNDNLNLYGVAIGTGENWTGCGDWGLQLETDVWQHVAVTRSADGTAGNSYINGVPVLVDGECSHVEPVGDAEQPFRLGSWILGENGRAWNGVLDDAFLFNRALSAADIAVIADLGLAGANVVAAVEPAGKLSTSWADIKTR